MTTAIRKRLKTYRDPKNKTQQKHERLTKSVNGPRRNEPTSVYKNISSQSWEMRQKMVRLLRLLSRAKIGLWKWGEFLKGTLKIQMGRRKP